MVPVPVLIARALWLMIPAYVANMGAVLVGGGPAIDGGRTWSDGRRILGDGKTWRGLLVAPLISVVLVGLLRDPLHVQALADLGLSRFGPDPWWALLAYALGVGALVGDATFSFLKRRRGFERGERWLGPDQLDFVLGSLVVGFLAAAALAAAGVTDGNWFLGNFTPGILAAVVLATPALHLIVNYIGWRIGVKDVPW